MSESEKVKADWFIASCFLGEAEIEEGQLEVLVDHAEVYLRATGSISWSEWSCLSTKSQAAFQKAGERIEDAKLVKLVDLLLPRLLAAIGRAQGVPE